MRIVKSKNLDKAANEVSYILLRRKPGDIQAAYKDLYAALRDTSPHGKLMEECGFTLEEMIEIIENLRDYGYGLERYYLPARLCLLSYQTIAVHSGSPARIAPAERAENVCRDGAKPKADWVPSVFYIKPTPSVSPLPVIRRIIG